MINTGETAQMPINNILDARKYYFEDTSFNLLMQKKIENVLLICSKYDAFVLEEDGRIDERLFNEYASLSIRYPPIIILAHSLEKAKEILKKQQIDLVITFLSAGSADAVEAGNRIKQDNPDIPVVVLTHLSREVYMRLDKESFRNIDYIFSWLGNSDILLAVIKLIEDQMNVEYDVENVGVQTIILVEDSVRYYSSYLPNIYKILFRQSKELMVEGLNEHQMMLAMRGRPKILLATSYEEAIVLYEKYKRNLLGIISDISFNRNGCKDQQAGIKLCKKVRRDDEFIPFILQSSDIENGRVAKDLGVGFLSKYSKTLSLELRKYITEYFLFGDFIFKDPITQEEIERASDLQSLQLKISRIPDASLEYHVRRNEFSRWLNARSLFPIAEMLKPIRQSDFRDINEIRNYLNEAFSNYRMNKGRGIIARFDKDRFDKYLVFSRIGESSIGGKARGLAFINSIIKNYRLFDKYENMIVSIPRTVAIGTDVFDEFMETNDLYKVGLSDLSDEEILNAFVSANIPDRIRDDLVSFISVIKNPIAIRSSSLLEDSMYQPFAGIYSTYMIPNTRISQKAMINQLETAIKCVYASVFYKGSKAYIASTSNLIDEEKMGIVLQEVCGSRYGNRFYPTISGVARSINYYPIAPEKFDDGIASIALGLGKYIVEGGTSLRFAPRYPKKALQLSSPDITLRETQKEFFALDLMSDSFKVSVDDGVNLQRLKLEDAEADGTLKYVGSTYDYEDNKVSDGLLGKGRRLVTFSSILNYHSIPLTDILNEILSIAQKEMNHPVEIEFAVNLDTPPDHPKIFHWLQIRPIVETYDKTIVKLEDVKRENALILSDSALGNGEIKNVYDIIYIKPEQFKPADSPLIAETIEHINDELVNKNRNYILIGPGRWGSNDPWLGIPVKWPQISNARLIVEMGLKNYRVDPSQGTHFFQNLTAFQVGYFTINPFMDDGLFDVSFLEKLPAVYEEKYVRHVHFDNPLLIRIDAHKNKGVVFKPGFSEK